MCFCHCFWNRSFDFLLKLMRTHTHSLMHAFVLNRNIVVSCFVLQFFANSIGMWIETESNKENKCVSVCLLHINPYINAIYLEQLSRKYSYYHVLDAIDFLPVMNSSQCLCHFIFVLL